MPIVTIQMTRGRSLEVKRRLVANVTRLVADELQVGKEKVMVLINEYERENWATAGELHSDRFGTGFGESGNPENK